MSDDAALGNGVEPGGNALMPISKDTVQDRVYASLRAAIIRSSAAMVAAGADLALGQIAGALEGAAAQSVGLDVVEIEREGLRQATLVAGKYVTPRLFVGFAQPITLREGNGLSLGEASQPEIEVERSPNSPPAAGISWTRCGSRGSAERRASRAWKALRSPSPAICSDRSRAAASPTP